MHPLDAIPAGRSDKYGDVSVERTGAHGFPDQEEPVALFRAADFYSLGILRSYLQALEGDHGVPAEQRESVRRQIAAFEDWRAANDDKIRLPGTTIPPDAL